MYGVITRFTDDFEFVFASETIFFRLLDDISPGRGIIIFNKEF